ncbi:FKBP-type peptidyl-prolyl cis-trans isomerase [Hydrogenophilus thermoluteolus]|uniref:Peptidyl-prolyl cis-trans isomerase n=1 Tax=Hydrogenophilus thermoluteolus TaxID=297 RepID=A0A2Z6DYQ8_HYDTE|nr:peptidylprolyl isomerase [Hydrogenophilus thermoluteolus]MBW7655733.1 peptidylprolyl isomerase [Hydrogenophilus thermoluteolus]BBD77395.1 peptidylprolyl isomerase [Hydrogenophilus thermoluteolus]GLW61208.1 peptidyl-prolyl cis-trans isomerase [Hydrogenophilus thermoluteolus]HNU20562.1 peptidylprolyl isomerase [Hydrogenophilus thermoluteolus]
MTTQQAAQAGDTVQVHYKGTLADGSVFDSSEGRDPLQFTLGAGQVIPGFEKAVEGMQVGERKTITIPADEAYGQRSERAMLQVPREQLPPEIEPEVGLQLVMQRADGQQIPVVVAEVTETHVTIDANHPLAGHDLTFEIELVAADRAA